MSNKRGGCEFCPRVELHGGRGLASVLLQRSDANSVVVVIPRLKGFPISFRHFRFVDSIQNLQEKVLTY